MANIPSSNIEQLLETAIDSALVDLHTCLPGSIISFDSVAQTVHAQVQIRRVHVDKNGIESTVAVPVLVDVPILFPKCAGFSITLPVKPGDNCLIFFSERDIDNWHNSGSLSNPRTRRKFDFSDGFCFPGVSTTNNRVSNYNSDDLEIRNDDSSAKIVLKLNGDIEISNATKIDINTPELNINAKTKITGDSEITGKLDATGEIKSGSISVTTHTHPGVQAGGDNTGQPV